ncbi:MAG: hypothetical protein R6V35_01365 [Candidatus Nanohaloarchaea archaeon]
MNFSNTKTALILLGLVLITSGCMNSAENSEAPTEDVEVDRTVNVTGGNIWYEIDGEREDLELEFEEGETVKFNFENVEGTHNLKIPELDAGTETFVGEETRSFVVTFDETGEFEFLCSVGNHAEQGQRGLITVT